MKNLFGFLFVSVFVVFSVMSADAKTVPEIKQLIHDGKYIEAEEAGVELNTADGYALAAQARLIRLDLTGKKKRKLKDIKGAEKLARKALELDPHNILAHLQLSGSLGMKSRKVGKVRAQLGGFVSESKVHIDFVLEKEPENAWALTYLGGWNLEVVARGGKSLANITYGATVPQGHEAYGKAIEKAPESRRIRYFYTISLVLLDPKENEELILENLAVAVKSEPDSHIDGVIKDRCTELYEAMQAKDYKKTKKLVAIFTGTKAA